MQHSIKRDGKDPPLVDDDRTASIGHLKANVNRNGPSVSIQQQPQKQQSTLDRRESQSSSSKTIGQRRPRGISPSEVDDSGTVTSKGEQEEVADEGDDASFSSSIPLDIRSMKMYIEKLLAEQETLLNPDTELVGYLAKAMQDLQKEELESSILSIDALEIEKLESALKPTPNVSSKPTPRHATTQAPKSPEQQTMISPHKSRSHQGNAAQLDGIEKHQKESLEQHDPVSLPLEKALSSEDGPTQVAKQSRQSINIESSPVEKSQPLHTPNGLPKLSDRSEILQQQERTQRRSNRTISVQADSSLNKMPEQLSLTLRTEEDTSQKGQLMKIPSTDVTKQDDLHTRNATRKQQGQDDHQAIPLQGRSPAQEVLTSKPRSVMKKASSSGSLRQSENNIPLVNSQQQIQLQPRKNKQSQPNSRQPRSDTEPAIYHRESSVKSISSTSTSQQRDNEARREQDQNQTQSRPQRTSEHNPYFIEQRSNTNERSLRSVSSGSVSQLGERSPRDSQHKVDRQQEGNLPPTSHFILQSLANRDSSVSSKQRDDQNIPDANLQPHRAKPVRATSLAQEKATQRSGAQDDVNYTRASSFKSTDQPTASHPVQHALRPHLQQDEDQDPNIRAQEHRLSQLPPVTSYYNHRSVATTASSPDVPQRQHVHEAPRSTRQQQPGQGHHSVISAQTNFAVQNHHSNRQSSFKSTADHHHQSDPYGPNADALQLNEHQSPRVNPPEAAVGRENHPGRSRSLNSILPTSERAPYSRTDSIRSAGTPPHRGEYARTTSQKKLEQKFHVFNTLYKDHGRSNSQGVITNDMMETCLKDAFEEDNIQKSRYESMLYQKFHLPGNTWLQDWRAYFSNNHPLLGICLHDPDHPVGTWKRVGILFGSMAFGLALTNFVYLSFIIWSDQGVNGTIRVANFDEGQDQSSSMSSFQQSATSLVSTYELILLFVGGPLHAFYDHFIWSIDMAPCFQSGGCLETRGWVGSFLSVMAIIVMLTFASVSVVIRAISQNVELRSISDTTGLLHGSRTEALQHLDRCKFNFLIWWCVELALDLFVFNFLVGTLIFSGCLSCGDCSPCMLGGRPQAIREMEQEMKNEEKNLNAHLKVHQDYNLLSGRSLVSTTSAARGRTT